VADRKTKPLGPLIVVMGFYSVGFLCRSSIGEVITREQRNETDCAQIDIRDSIVVAPR
jgi:hypothetical protein